VCGILNSSLTAGLSSCYRPGWRDFKFLILKYAHSDRLVHLGRRHVEERFIQCTEFGDMKYWKSVQRTGVSTEGLLRRPCVEC